MAAPTPPHLTLHYFDLNGLGARIRLACAVGGLALEDVRFKADRSDFAALKAAGDLPFGQAPLLVVRDAAGAETKLAQSSAILRYVCTLAGLHPAADALAAAAIDAALVAEQDAFAAVGCAKYRERNGFAALAGEALAATEAALRSDVVPRHLGFLERALARSATGWVCGTARPSAADFAWATQLRDISVNQHSAFLTKELLEPFPAARAFLARFLALPEVAAYYTAHP
jgi:glutathione S-transferase